MKRSSWILFAVLFASCLRDERREDKQLDKEVQELERLALFQREYYFDAIKWSRKNPDSTAFYEQKVDSIVTLYKIQMRRYDSLIKDYNQKDSK